MSSAAPFSGKVHLLRCWLLFLAGRLNWRALASLTLAAQPGAWSHALLCWIHRNLTTRQTPTDQRAGSQRLPWLTQLRLTDYLRLKNNFRCCLETQKNKTHMSSCLRTCCVFLSRLVHYNVRYSMLDLRGLFLNGICCQWDRICSCWLVLWTCFTGVASLTLGMKEKCHCSMQWPWSEHAWVSPSTLCRSHANLLQYLSKLVVMLPLVSPHNDRANVCRS